MRNKYPRGWRSAVVLPFLLTLPQFSLAAGLGDISIQSGLEQRLRAEVEVLGINGAPLEAACFQFRRPVDAERQDIPWLSDGEISVTHAGGRTFLVITSRKPVNEPAVMLALRVACAVDVTREYTLLLSPPGEGQPVTAPSSAVIQSESAVGGKASDKSKAQALTWTVGPADTLPSLAAGVYPRSRRMQQRFISKVVEENPELALDPLGRQPLEPGSLLKVPRLAGVAAKPPVRAQRDAEAASVDRAGTKIAQADGSAKPPRHAKTPEKPKAAAASSGDRLMLDAPRLEIVDSGPATPEAVGARLNAVQDRIKALDRQVRAIAGDGREGGATPADPSLRVMTSRLAQVQNTLDQVRVQAGLPTAPAPVSVPASAAAQAPIASAAPAPAPQEPATPVTPITVAPTAVAAPVATPVPATAPIPAAIATAAPVPAGGMSPTLAMAMFGANGIFGLGLFLMYRRQSRLLQQGQPVDGPMSLAPVALEPTLQHSIGPLSSFLEGGSRQPKLAASPVSGRVQAAEPAPMTVSEVDSVLEMADVMVQVSRTPAAAQVLKDFIDARTEQVIDPWIKLLDIYRSLDMKDDFDRLAQGMHRNYNVDIVKWWDHSEVVREAIAQAPLCWGKSSLEEFPHIMETLASTWGTPECADYLERIVLDNRDGTRQGFSLPVIQDILFLARLLKAELQIPTESPAFV